MTSLTTFETFETKLLLEGKLITILRGQKSDATARADVTWKIRQFFAYLFTYRKYSMKKVV